MNRNMYYVAIAFFGMINGIPFFHPMYVVAFGYSIQLMAEPLFGSTSLIAYFASLMLSTAIIILAGIPAHSMSASRASRTIRRWRRFGYGLPVPHF